MTVPAADIRLIQERLKKNSLYSGVVDGEWGSGTRGGIHRCIDIVEDKKSSPKIISTVNYATALEVAFHEAVVRQAYLDGAGVWTWSVGLTSATGHDVRRYIGAAQPMQHCLNVYVWALINYARHVDEVFAGVELPQNVYAGALSFHWNTGALRRASWVDLYISGDHADAEESFKSWNKVGGKVVHGLSVRRDKEADLIWRGKWASNGQIREYTRLTTGSTPVWSSGVMRDVRSEMLIAFGENVSPVLDKSPVPHNVPPAPTLTAT
jgi:lysozyme